MELKGLPHCYPGEANPVATEEPLWQTPKVQQPHEKQNEIRCKIKQAMDRNQQIREGEFCTLPEAEISLEMDDETPINVRQYRIPHAAQEGMDKHFQKLLKLRIIAEAPHATSWNSPILAARKILEDGT
eukprot:Nk52_evm1s1808 gene=Nk52_evmTU1s1808